MFAVKSGLFSLVSLFSFAQAKTNHPPLVNHVNVMSELKEHFAKKEQTTPKPTRTDKTPTLAYMKAIEAGKFPWCGWGSNPAASAIKQYRKDYGTIIDLAIDRERQYCNDYYVFYHAHPNSFHVFHDFLKHAWAFLNISGKRADFEFLRMWQEAKNEIDVNKYLATSSGYDIDTWVCANLSLFGNLGDSICHSFAYFKDNLKQNIFLTETLLKRFFTHYGLNSSYVKDLINLNQNYTTKEGRLVQFFIPKDKVDRYVYLSSTGSATWPIPIVSSIWDNRLGRHTKIAPILDKYIDDIASITNFDSLQARILYSKDFMLDPSNDLKIFTYITIKDADKQRYDKELKDICSKIFAEWIKKEAHKNLEDTRLGRLIDLMK